MSYMDVKTAADRWELTERRITTLCRDGRIAGAKKEAGLWLIPDDAEKPVDGRRNKFTRAMKATAKLPLPIGVSDFKELVSGYYVTAMKQEGITHFFKIGGSFYKKRVKLLSDTE